MKRSSLREWLFALARFDVRSTLPAAIQNVMQPGLLDRTFQDALLPEFLFPALADVQPWGDHLGDTVTFTRGGLLAPVPTPITGSDPSPQTYGFEQYSMTMDQYGNSIDTNLLQSAMILASKYLEDIQKLGINAGQTLNRIARNKLYGAYRGGRTWAVGAGTAALPLIVDDVSGFTTNPINGTPSAVSASNPLPITVAGVAKNVVAVNVGTKTLTLDATATWVDGDVVIATNAPTTVRAGARTSAKTLVSTDVATFALFRAAVARLRTQNVPTVGGHYTAHIDPTTEAELFADSEFQLLYRGRAESPVWQDLSIGRFAGIDWVRNNECETKLVGSVTVRRPIVVGEGALVVGPFRSMGELLREVPSEAAGGDVAMVDTPAPGVSVAKITRIPQDRLQQILSTSWSWVGDFAIPSDAVTGDTGLFKRAVVIEHA